MCVSEVKLNYFIVFISVHFKIENCELSAISTMCDNALLSKEQNRKNSKAKLWGFP